MAVMSQAERAIQEHAQLVALDPEAWHRANLYGSLLFGAIAEGMMPRAADVWALATVQQIEDHARAIYFTNAGLVGQA